MKEKNSRGAGAAAYDAKIGSHVQEERWADERQRHVNRDAAWGRKGPWCATDWRGVVVQPCFGKAVLVQVGQPVGDSPAGCRLAVASS